MNEALNLLFPILDQKIPDVLWRLIYYRLQFLKQRLGYGRCRTLSESLQKEVSHPPVYLILVIAYCINDQSIRLGCIYQSPFVSTSYIHPRIPRFSRNMFSVSISAYFVYMLLSCLYVLVFITRLSRCCGVGYLGIGKRTAVSCTRII